MEYLSSKGYVHKQLAAKNILLSRNMMCKVSGGRGVTVGSGGGTVGSGGGTVGSGGGTVGSGGEGTVGSGGEA